MIYVGKKINDPIVKRIIEKFKSFREERREKEGRKEKKKFRAKEAAATFFSEVRRNRFLNEVPRQNKRRGNSLPRGKLGRPLFRDPTTHLSHRR